MILLGTFHTLDAHFSCSPFFSVIILHAISLHSPFTKVEYVLLKRNYSLCSCSAHGRVRNTTTTEAIVYYLYRYTSDFIFFVCRICVIFFGFSLCVFFISFSIGIWLLFFSYQVTHTRYKKAIRIQMTGRQIHLFWLIFVGSCAHIKRLYYIQVATHHTIKVLVLTASSRSNTTISAAHCDAVVVFCFCSVFFVFHFICPIHTPYTCLLRFAGVWFGMVWLAWKGSAALDYGKIVFFVFFLFRLFIFRLTFHCLLNR